jgi:hypothetical protein
MMLSGTLVYDGELMFPIVDVELRDGQIFFTARQYFTGPVTLTAGTHMVRLYASDKSLVFATEVTNQKAETVEDGYMTVEQPVTVI